MNYDSYIESRAFEDEYLEERRKRRERREERAEHEFDRKRDEESGKCPEAFTRDFAAGLKDQFGIGEGNDADSKQG